MLFRKKKSVLNRKPAFLQVVIKPGNNNINNKLKAIFWKKLYF
jgi:hypothetical protein